MMIRESLDLISELSKQLRAISYLLHPPLLDEVPSSTRSAKPLYGCSIPTRASKLFPVLRQPTIFLRSVDFALSDSATKAYPNDFAAFGYNLYFGQFEKALDT